jgi:hypothetical protein
MRRSDAASDALRFTAAVLGVYLLSLGPAWFLSGPQGLEGLTYATGFCLLPGWVVFASRGLYKSAKSAAFGVLLAIGSRLTVAICGAILIVRFRPDLGWQAFLLWLVILYPFCLAVETWLLVRAVERVEEETHPSPSSGH